MEIKKETKLVEEEITTYIAIDGTKFYTERECKRYEKGLEKEELIKRAEKFRIKDLDYRVPIDDSALPSENNYFVWYKVETPEDFDVIDKAYRNQVVEPETYPEMICVETNGNEEYEGDVYSYNLSGMKASTEYFWKDMGYKVTFEKVEEKC